MKWELICCVLGCLIALRLQEFTMSQVNCTGSQNKLGPLHESRRERWEGGGRSGGLRHTPALRALSCEKCPFLDIVQAALGVRLGQQEAQVRVRGVFALGTSGQ